MVITNRVKKVLLSFACCAALILLPLSIGALAQEDALKDVKKGVKKGAQEVKKGAETAAEKAKKPADTEGEETGQMDLPATAGELPLLALAGALALASAGASRLVCRAVNRTPSQRKD
jgi:hypothetical protein